MKNNTYLITEQLTIIYLVNKSEANFAKLNTHLHRCFKDKLRLNKSLSDLEKEDIITDSMVNIWDRLKKDFTVNQLVHAYYAAILHNTIKDVLRKKKQENVVSYSDLDPDLSMLIQPDMVYSLNKYPSDTYDNRQVLETAMNYLSRKETDLILLRHVKGIKQKEVAEILNTPLNTIKSQERVAKMKMRKLVGAL